MSRKVLFVLLIWGLTACGGMATAPGPVEVTLVYSGNLDGELEPCGCSEGGDLGGILRRLSLLNELRAQDPGLIALSAGGLLANESPRDRLKSEYILSGFNAFAYDAVGLQWRDLAYGHDFLAAQPLPWVSSNWRHGEEFLSKRVIEKGGISLAFFSWLDPKASPFKEMAGMHQGVTENASQLMWELAEAKRRGMMTVLATTLPLKKAARLFKLEDVDILMVRAGYEIYADPLMENKTLVLSPGSRGMRLGKLALTIENGRIQSWQHQSLDMPPEIVDAPELLPWYQEYNDKVKEAYLASVALKKAQEAGESPYAGEETCQQCHAKEHEAWSMSPHAAAFEKLEDVEKSFDPDCIVCHTVAFEKEGGYIDTLTTPGLINVQCENCHGAGRAHVDSNGAEKPGNAGWPMERMCAQCHVQAHSPEFKVEAYWPRIAH